MTKKITSNVDAIHRLPKGVTPENFDDFLAKNYPREAAVRQQYGMSRRTFMKMMGASLALAGFGAVGCTARPPGEEILPYVRMPEEVIPGKPLFFASSMVLSGYSTGVLIETHEGRPTRVDGNPQHPATLGGSSAYLQGSILELYNPERSTDVRQDGEDSDWETFIADLTNRLESDGSNEGIRILTETVSSPTLAKQIEALIEQYSGAKWYQYEPISRDNVIQGSQLAFDEVVNTVYNFEAANVVLSIDADFLSSMPGSLRYIRDFTNGRKVREGDTEMKRLYAIESTPTITGATADHRLALRPSDVEGFVRALAAAFVVEAQAPDDTSAWPEAWLSEVIDELQENAGSSIVIAGDEQPPVVHALVHAINSGLGNVGTTVTYTPAVEANPVVLTEQLAELIAEMEAGDVQSLFILGGNPVYNAPADLGFVEALEDVQYSVHLSLYFDETSELCDWHIPATTYFEEWSDARAYDGTLSVVQPPIGPLYATLRSPHELLAALMLDERSGYEIVRDAWQEDFTGDDFEAYWRRTLHDGVAPDSAFEPVEPSLRSDFGTELAAIETRDTGGDLEIIFRQDASIYDGRFGNNTWLQELPRPITQMTWDNVALISRNTANDLDLTLDLDDNERLLELTFQGRTMRVPYWISPGHADDAITVFLGYGHGLSADLDEDESFNAYAIRTSDAMWFGTGVTVENLEESYELAPIRGKFDPDDLGGQYTDTPVRSASLIDFLDDPEIFQQQQEVISILPSVDYSDGYSWGMTIDLSACVGCNACIIACQSENNIPTVGKENVAKAREMHWLRVDRYYDEDGDDLTTQFQPVPCMHCETAPCELVCPVEATVHDTEGLNNMVYNRCIGTRYCSANCPYSVRRFNFMQYVADDELLIEQRNPNVSVRVEGVMEKCSFCTQRINAARIDANNEDRDILDGEVMPACAAACPAKAISFGNLNDPNAEVVELKAQPLNYGLLEELGTKPRTTYLARLTNPNSALEDE